PGRVEWVQPQAERLFKMVAADRISKNVEGGRQRIPKSQIHVIVRNGAGRQGLATEVAAELEQRGYHIVKVETAAKPYARTFVRYGPNGEARASRLLHELKRTRTVSAPAARTQRVILVLGADWRGMRP